MGCFRGLGHVGVPFIGTTLHLSLRVILTHLLVMQLGLPAVAFATGAGWILVVCYQMLKYSHTLRAESSRLTLYAAPTISS